MEMDPMDGEDIAPARKETAHDRIARKVSAGQDRNRARSSVREVMEDHPIALLAGGLLIGALAARLLPRSMFGKLGFDKLGKRTAALAAAGAEIAALYGARIGSAASEAGQHGREKLEELGETASETAADAGRRAAGLADLAVTTAKAVGTQALRRVAEVTDRVRH